MSISTLRFSFVLLVIASCLTLSSQSFPCGGRTNCVCDQPTAQEVDCQNVNCNNQIIIFVHGGGHVVATVGLQQRQPVVAFVRTHSRKVGLSDHEESRMETA